MEGSRSNKTPSEHLLKIRQHIESFPTKDTHYGGCSKKYLDARLDVKQMHQMFCSTYPDVAIKYKFYLKYFQENFALSFGRPQIDVCSKCEELTQKQSNRALNKKSKLVFKAELEVHKRKAQKFYRKINAIEQLCENRTDVLGICFDYMQNVPLPDIPVQEIFYYRQLWLYSFCIHNLKTKEAIFYCYHEGRGKKGANEVCSFLNDYFENFVSPEIKEVHIFSDGCPGQNKNNTVIRYLLSLTDTKKFNRIIQYFPVRGHSFLPCDRHFGRIKRILKKHDRLYVPDEYYSLIPKASTKFKYSVRIISKPSREIQDYKTWWPIWYKKNTVSVESAKLKKPKAQKTQFMASRFNQLIYSSEYTGSIKAYDYIDGLISHTFIVGSSSQPPSILQHPAYLSDRIPINIKKINDIKKVMQYEYIPDEFATFWNDLCNWPTTNSDADSL